MKTKIFVTVWIALNMVAMAASAEEIQLNCKFTSSTKLVDTNANNPKYETKKYESEYLVFFNEKNNEASYINLGLENLKHKAPLKIVHTSASMITFIEAVEDADNHFSISVFWKEGKNKEYPAIQFFHSWMPRINFYNPEINLGTCSSFPI